MSADPSRTKTQDDDAGLTADELAQIRHELEADVARLRAEVADAEAQASSTAGEPAIGGQDEADLSTRQFEQGQASSLAQNARRLLSRSEHALHRLDHGSYERGEPIGRPRLMTFPRACLCLQCQSLQTQHRP